MNDERKDDLNDEGDDHPPTVPFTRVTPSSPANGVRRSQSWDLFIGGLVIASIVSAFLPSLQLTWLTCQLMLGILITHCLLAGIWFAIGPGHIVSRCLATPLWIGLATALGGIFNRPDGQLYVTFFCSLTTTLIVATVVGSVCLVGGMRLAWSGDPASKQPFQYHLKHLMMLMLATSVLLGAGRVLVHYLSTDWIFRELVNYVPGIAAWSIAAIPPVFVVLGARDERALQIGIFACSAFAIFTFVTGNFFMHQVTRLPEVMVNPLIAVGVIAYIGTHLGLLMQRQAGYRLVKR